MVLVGETGLPADKVAEGGAESRTVSKRKSLLMPFVYGVSMESPRHRLDLQMYQERKSVVAGQQCCWGRQS